MNIFRKILGDLSRYFKYEYGVDPVLDQERFEPTQWVLPIEEQINVLKRYFIGIEIDQSILKGKSINHREKIS